MERLTHERVNGIKKDEVRAMLRETYTALKQYEKIGPMASSTSRSTSPTCGTRPTAPPTA